MSPDDVIRARNALGWSQTRLAAEASVRRGLVERIETGQPVPRDSLDAVRGAFVNAGLSHLLQA